jgi:hypothetical protein
VWPPVLWWRLVKLPPPVKLQSRLRETFLGPWRAISLEQQKARR